MLLLADRRLPDGARWEYQLKFDGYRAIAFKTGGKIHLRSRNDNDFSIRYPDVVKGLAKLPDETVIDGEVIALDDDGRPSFNILQNYGSSNAPVLYFVFDVMVLAGRDVMASRSRRGASCWRRRSCRSWANRSDTRRRWMRSLPVLIESVKAQGLEGLVAKRRDSRYEPGLRSGAWQKMRVNRGQEFVIGGYTVGTKTFDALVFGYYEGDRLIYAARTRNGFTPVVARAAVQEIPRAGDQGVPVRESAGGEERPMGCGPDGGEDEGLPLAEAGAGRRRSSSWSGPAKITCGTPSSLRCATTSRRRMSGANEARSARFLAPSARQSSWKLDRNLG